MKRLFAVFPLFLPLITAGCDKILGPDSQEPQKLIMPLSVGSWWVQESTVYGKSGEQKTLSVDTIRVLRDTLISDQKWTIVLEYGSENLYRNTSLGFWLRYRGDSLLKYKYPAAVTDTFQCYSGNSSTKVISIDSTVTVPAGSFHCYVYLTSGGGSTTRSHWVDFCSPGLGLVYVEFYMTFDISEPEFLYSGQRLLAYELR